MITLATFQRDSKVFAGLSIPYGVETGNVKPQKRSKLKEKVTSVRTAILGGGDIGFPMFFAGVVMKQVSFLETLIIPVCVSIALFLLLYYGKQDRFYPAMPFLSLGCVVGYLLILLV